MNTPIEPSSQICFRKARSVDELATLLRIRAASFRRTVLEVFEPPNETGFNVDRYDACATHLGLFAESHGQERAIGYIRFVSDTAVRDPQVLELARRTRSLSEILAPRPVPLPFAGYWPERDVVQRALHSMRGSGQRFVEASRLSLLTEFQSLNLGLFMVRAAVAYIVSMEIHAVWMWTHSHRRRFYRRVGFRRAPGTSDQANRIVPGTYCCLIGRPEWIPPGFLPTVESMASQFSKTRAIRGRIRLSREPYSAPACA